MFRQLLTGLALIALVAVPASAQTAEGLIAKNLEAKGGLEKIKAVQTMRMTGTMTLGPGMEAPFVMELKRPNQMRLDFTMQGMTGTQAYDGKVGWQVVPFAGRKEPQELPSEALKQLEEQADMDGPLVDFQAKGHKVEYLGREKVEGTDTYVLRVTLKSGDVRKIFLDAQQHLEIRTEGKANVRGAQMEGESTIGDYREVAGLMLPHSMESGQKGSPQKMRMTIQKIEVNVPVDDARFRMPKGSGTGN